MIATELGAVWGDRKAPGNRPILRRNRVRSGNVNHEPDEAHGDTLGPSLALFPSPEDAPIPELKPDSPGTIVSRS